MIKYLLPPEYGFTTHLENGVPKLNLCQDKLCLKEKSTPEGHVVTGSAGIIYRTLTSPFGSSSVTKKEMRDLYYPTLVALRVFAYETVGFRYNITNMMYYIAWHFYGQECTGDFMDKTWLAYLVIKEYKDDMTFTFYPKAFEPLLPQYASLLYKHGKHSKYWGKTITEENERDFIDEGNWPDSSASKESVGELLAKKYFDKTGIEYIYDQPVDYVCKYCDQQVLRPDFILPEYDVVVEIHGQQHLNFNKGFHVTYEDFIHQQLRDIDMRNFCHEYGYSLIEVPYTGHEDVPWYIARGLRNITRRNAKRKAKKIDE